MKIISKHKDFYDYLVQDNDPDIIFVRTPKRHYVNFDDLFNKEYNWRSGYYSYDDYKFSVNAGNYIFGVYPYVYSQPYLKLKYINTIGNREDIKIVLNKKIINKCINCDPDSYNNLKSLCENEISKLNNVKSFDFKIKCFDLSKMFSRLTWKVECKTIFEKLQSPVFVKFYNELFSDSTYSDLVNYDPKNPTQYVTGISFNKLNLNILKYWIDDLNDINTYNNIENFLWSIKQEPISVPDNKTKIISHGFDLKTSFRNIK